MLPQTGVGTIWYIHTRSFEGLGPPPPKKSVASSATKVAPHPLSRRHQRDRTCFPNSAPSSRMKKKRTHPLHTTTCSFHVFSFFLGLFTKQSYSASTPHPRSPQASCPPPPPPPIPPRATFFICLVGLVQEILHLLLAEDAELAVLTHHSHLKTRMQAQHERMVKRQNIIQRAHQQKPGMHAYLGTWGARLLSATLVETAREVQA